MPLVIESFFFFKHFRAPEMSPAHSKDKMLSGMKGKETQSYVRGEMQDTTTSKIDTNPTPTSISTNRYVRN